MRTVIIAGKSIHKIPGIQIPKCLVKYNGYSSISRLIKNLKKYGIKDISVIVGTEGPEWAEKNIIKILKFCKNIIPERNNELLAALTKKEDTLIINGSNILFGDTLEKLMTFYESNTTLLTKDLPWQYYDYSFVYTKFHQILEIGKFIYSPKATAFSGTMKIVKNDIDYLIKLIKKYNDNDMALRELCKIRDIYEYRTAKWKDIDEF